MFFTYNKTLLPCYKWNNVVVSSILRNYEFQYTAEKKSESVLSYFKSTKIYFLETRHKHLQCSYLNSFSFSPSLKKNKKQTLSVWSQHPDESLPMHRPGFKQRQRQVRWAERSPDTLTFSSGRHCIGGWLPGSQVSAACRPCFLGGPLWVIGLRGWKDFEWKFSQNISPSCWRENGLRTGRARSAERRVDGTSLLPSSQRWVRLCLWLMKCQSRTFCCSQTNRYK